jgi:ATP-dependent protease ClpP protease subunit
MLKWNGNIIKKKNMKKSKISVADIASLSNPTNDDDFPFELPNIFEGMNNHNMYSNANHIYFNDDINDTTSFNLCKELRIVKNRMITMMNTYESPDIKIPIYLHLTTNGGSIFSALKIIDCINSLKYPVYSIIEGYVASAGTLISISCEKRYIMENAYMLIHQLSSEFWGKMAEIEDEFSNLKKLTEHIEKMYIDKTKIKKKELEKMLKKDINLNSKESITKGLVDEVWI